MQKNLCDGALFNETAEINSRPTTFVEKAFTKEVYL